MTTVHCWDEYTSYEKRLIMEELKLARNLGKFLEASIALDVAWGITSIFIHQRIKTNGCKSYLLSYLLQRCGLKKIRVSKQQSDLIETEDYTYAQVKEALREIMKHPEWIEDFKEKEKDNKILLDFTFNMTTEELRKYY